MKDAVQGFVYWTVLCYHPYLAHLLFAVLLLLSSYKKKNSTRTI